MLCQSCGTDVKKGMKICPACGEDVVTAYTAAIPRQSSQTGPVDYNYLIPPPPPSGALAPEAKLNGKSELPTPTQPPPLPPTRVAPDEAPTPTANKPPAFVPSAPLAPSVALPANGAPTREATPPTDVINPADALRQVEAVKAGAIICRRCNHELKAGAKFCSVCGTSIEPSAVAKAIAMAGNGMQQALNIVRQGLRQTTMPAAALMLLAMTAVFVTIALVQYLIPLGVDDTSYSPLIYHLRGIVFLLLALISVVASLVVSRR